MIMDKYFICLANSYKRGGRCIAGVEISYNTLDEWSVVRNADGTPRWIRPTAANTMFGEIPIVDAAKIMGITRQNFSTIKNMGTCTPATAAKIANGLGVEVEELIESEV